MPPPTGTVNDFADVISPQDEARIAAVIEEVRVKSGGGEIAVVTLPSLEGRTRDEVGLQILREWGIGAKGAVGDERSNTGALVLVVPRERQAKIELGYGANTFIVAAEAGRIRDELMFPEFRKGNFGNGIYLAVVALGQEYAERFDFQLTGGGALPPAAREPAPQPGSGRRGGGGSLLWLVLIVIFVILSNRGGGGRGGRRRRRGGFPIILPFPMGGGGGGWGGGGFGGGGGGGFGGFGGGSGGGGGAGGEW